MQLQDWHRYVIAIGLAFSIGFLESFGEGGKMVEGVRHGAHSLIPTLIALQMTLKGGGGNGNDKFKSA